MSERSMSLIDTLIGEIDRVIKVLAAPTHASRVSPAAGLDASPLAPGESTLSARLMRVNHSGEVAAQALYQGQALTARSARVAAGMRRAAAEERDHLAWCDGRIKELGGSTSRLNPLWYAGSFALGAVAGAVGDRVSLGFVAETERQVEAHLHDHLDRLPESDRRSRAIVEQMAVDEATHGAQAAALGANRLPAVVRKAMGLASRVMTRSAYWV